MAGDFLWFTVAESLGIFSFGVNAVILAHNRGYSALGTVLVTAASAMGGSTVRDLLLGPAAQPFVWATAPSLLLLTLSFALLYALFAPVRAVIDRRDHFVRQTSEALAFASLTALGAAKATLLLMPVVPGGLWGGIALPMLAVVIGMIGSTAGLLLRDLLLGETPTVLKKGAGLLEPVLATAVVVATLLSIGLPKPWAVLAGFLIALAVRLPRIWATRPRQKVQPA
jgi:uncharacterized membrane protein YeiH